MRNNFLFYSEQESNSLIWQNYSLKENAKTLIPISKHFKRKLKC